MHTCMHTLDCRSKTSLLKTNMEAIQMIDSKMLCLLEIPYSEFRSWFWIWTSQAYVNKVPRIFPVWMIIHHFFPSEVLRACIHRSSSLARSSVKVVSWDWDFNRSRNWRIWVHDSNVGGFVCRETSLTRLEATSGSTPLRWVLEI